MKITFLIPPAYPQERAPDRCFGCNFGLTFQQPIHILYPAVVLEKAEFEVEFIDCIVEKKNKKWLENYVKNKNSDVYVFFTVYLAEKTDLYWRDRIRELEDNAIIIFMGPEPTRVPERFLKDEKTFVVRGEPEYTMLELVKKLSKNQSVDSVIGLSFIKGKKVVNNKPRHFIEDLDKLPFPARHLINNPKAYFNPKLKGRPTTTMFTSRQCWGNCIYCIAAAYNFAREIEWKKYYSIKPPVRARNPKNIYEEFKLVKKQGYKSVAIMDDNFMGVPTPDYKQRIIKLCELITPLKMEWGCLEHNEVIPIERNGLIETVKIGDFVNSIVEKTKNNINELKDVSVISFTKKQKIVKKQILIAGRKLTNEKIKKVILDYGRRITATEDHKLFILNDKKIEKKAIKDLKINDKVLVAKNINLNGNLKEINVLKEFLKLPNEELNRIYVLGLNKQLKNQIPNNYWRLRYKSKRNKSGYPAIPLKLIKNMKFKQTNDTRLHTTMMDIQAKIKITPELMRLLGYYASEGHINFRKNSYFISLGFGYNEDELVKDAAFSVKKVFNIKCNVTKSKKHSYQTVRFGGKILSLFFDKILKVGKGAFNKQVPPIIFNVSKELQNHFLNAYILGDGYKDKKNKRKEMYTVSYKLAQDIMLLSLNLGYNPQIQSKNNTKTNKKIFTIRIPFSVNNRFGINEIGDMTTLKVKKIEDVENRNRYVFDLTVSGNPHSYIAGCGIAVSNCLARADQLQDEEILQKMRDAGCVYVDIGVESFDKKILDYVKKGMTPGEQINAIMLLKKVGIQPKINILLGASPLQNIKDIKWTMAILKMLDIDFVSFGIVAPHPAIEFYKIVKKNKWFTTPSNDWEGVDPYNEGIVDFPGMPHEKLEMLVKWSYRAYYLRPYYIFKRLKNLRSFHEFFEDAKIAFKLFIRRRII